MFSIRGFDFPSFHSSRNPAKAQQKAASFAREATNPNDPRYRELSSMMCWDAVKHCTVSAGLSKRGVDAKTGLVSQKDQQVSSRDMMARVPAGQAVGFFDGNKPAHVMLSLDNGKAAGNKNNCIGLGRPIGWEVVDLKQLSWKDSGKVSAPGLHGPERSLSVYTRPFGQSWKR